MRLLLSKRATTHRSNVAKNARVTKGDLVRTFMLPILLPSSRMLVPALTVNLSVYTPAGPVLDF
jgi:hypothetical protein